MTTLSLSFFDLTYSENKAIGHSEGDYVTLAGRIVEEDKTLQDFDAQVGQFLAILDIKFKSYIRLTNPHNSRATKNLSEETKIGRKDFIELFDMSESDAESFSQTQFIITPKTDGWYIEKIKDDDISIFVGSTKVLRTGVDLQDGDMIRIDGEHSHFLNVTIERLDTDGQTLTNGEVFTSREMIVNLPNDVPISELQPYLDEILQRKTSNYKIVLGELLISSSEKKDGQSVLGKYYLPDELPMSQLRLHVNGHEKNPLRFMPTETNRRFALKAQAIKDYVPFEMFQVDELAILEYRNAEWTIKARNMGDLPMFLDGRKLLIDQNHRLSHGQVIAFGISPSKAVLRLVVEVESANNQIPTEDKNNG